MPERDITGRDDLIMAQALATAIHFLEKAPDLLRPDSNIADMRRLLFTLWSGRGATSSRSCRELIASAQTSSQCHNRNRGDDE
jgi:hypothetical protein